MCVLMEQWLDMRLNGAVAGVRLHGAVARCAS